MVSGARSCTNDRSICTIGIEESASIVIINSSQLAALKFPHLFFIVPVYRGGWRCCSVSLRVQSRVCRHAPISSAAVVPLSRDLRVFPELNERNASTTSCIHTE